MTEKPTLFDLFITFAKCGVMTFGGGYAMLPMLEREVVNKKGWATEDEILDYFAIGQCTPGIIAVNTSTFIGYKMRKTPGAIFATLGMVFPSWIIIMLLASVLKVFQNNVYVVKAFAGIRVAVCALMTVSIYKLAKKAIHSVETTVCAVLVLLAQIFLGVSPVVIVILTIAYGLVSYYFHKSREGV